MAINCDKSAENPHKLLSSYTESYFNYLHSKSSQNFIDLKLKFRNSSTNTDKVAARLRVYMPLCVHWWDLFYLFFAAMIRKPSPIIRLLHPQAAQIWMFDMYEHSFLSHRSPTEWELNSGSITFSHKWTVTPHSMYTHRHMPRFWGKNTLRKKNKTSSSSISC